MDPADRFLTAGLVALLLAAGCAIAASRASADPVEYSPPADRVIEPIGEPEACPPVPDQLAVDVQYSDEVVELRGLRRATARACVATTDRLDEAVKRLWWLTAEQVERGAQGVAINEDLDQLVAGLCLKAHPCSVEVSSDLASELSTAELTSSIDAGAESTSFALYLFIGLALAGGLVAMIWIMIQRSG